MKSITDLEEAYSLPEKSRFAEIKEVQPDGTTLITPMFRSIVATECTPDTIFIFMDKDGRMMTVEYEKDGAYKTPVW